MFLPPAREREGGRFGYFLPQIPSARPAELAASPGRGPSLVKDDQEVTDMLLWSLGRVCLVQRTRMCWGGQRALRPPLRRGSWGLSIRKQEPAQGGPARLSPASSFSLLCHLASVWVQFCTQNSVTALTYSSILLIVNFLFLNLVIAPALPSHFSRLK